MKFDEIVKALRLCGETTECISERIGCPYCENTDDCKRQLLFDAADIIEAQQQEIDRLKDENASIRNWNACEEEQYGQLLESDKRRIKLEEQIEAQQQEIKQLEYTLKKASDLIENANSNGILEHVARNCMFIKEIDDLLGGKEDA